MLLRIRDLSYRYPGASGDALCAVSLQVARGQIQGLLGPNGAGKSTLIAHLSGALSVTSGTIEFDGQTLDQLRRHQPARIAVAPQSLAFYPMLSVRENLACFAAAARLTGQRRGARIEACAALAQLERFMNTRAQRLSGGLQRRLNLAIALLPEPDLLLLDEPTVGVDPQSRAFILQSIRALAAQGMAVIYASHYMEEVEAIAQRVVILDQGRVLREGALADLLAEDSRMLLLRVDPADTASLLRVAGPWGQASAAGRQGLWQIGLNDGASPVALLAALERAGVGVRQAEFGRSRIESVFMALTRPDLRDGS
jgi:ABC-2 type transport system ATP-binding protein